MAASTSGSRTYILLLCRVAALVQSLSFLWEEHLGRRAVVPNTISAGSFGRIHRSVGTVDKLGNAP